MVERGADMYKRTKLGRSCMWLAAFRDEDDMIELFIKKGVPVDEKSFKGRSALHAACGIVNPHCAKVLFEHNADVNILDSDGKTPFEYVVNARVQALMIREFAILSFESKTICDENLYYLLIDESIRNGFKNCSEELEKMKDVKFYSNYSLLDVLQMRRNRKKLTRLVRNVDFVEAFKSGWSRETFKNYASDLDIIILEAEERKTNWISEEKKLLSIFKDFLPELVIRKLAFHVKCQDLYFE